MQPRNLRKTQTEIVGQLYKSGEYMIRQWKGGQFPLVRVPVPGPILSCVFVCFLGFSCPVSLLRIEGTDDCSGKPGG